MTLEFILCMFISFWVILFHVYIDFIVACVYWYYNTCIIYIVWYFILLLYSLTMVNLPWYRKLNIPWDILKYISWGILILAYTTFFSYCLYLDVPGNITLIVLSAIIITWSIWKLIANHVIAFCQRHKKNTLRKRISTIRK